MTTLAHLDPETKDAVESGEKQDRNIEIGEKYVKIDNVMLKRMGNK